MGEPELGHQRERFEERFRAELSWNYATTTEVGHWYSHLVNDLTLATGGEAILYFSATFAPPLGDTPGSLAVVAFTDTTVVHAHCDGDPATTAPALEVIVTARHDLTSFSLESRDSRDNPELALTRITVNYPLFSRVLPLGASNWWGREADTVALITALRRDVLA